MSVGFNPPRWRDFHFHFEKREDGEHVCVTETVLRWRDSRDTSREIVVAAGFENDGASMGPLARAVCRILGTPWEEALRAAVLHDWLYRGGKVLVNGLQIEPTRAYADAVFRRALEVDGANWLARNLCWAGVRLGGWLAWRRNRRA